MKSQAPRRRSLGMCLKVSQLLVLLALGGCASPTAIINEPTTVASSTMATIAPTTTASTATPLLTTTATSAPVTVTPSAPAPTDTPTPAPSPTATAPPSPTPPAPIAGTLLLYTTPVTDANGQAHWAFRTLPPLPQFDSAAFDTLYGPDNGFSDFSMFFADSNPQLSPDGQSLLVAGTRGSPEHGVAGTPTWLIDLTTGAARQLFADGVIATWSPAGDAITYVEDGTLFTISTAAGATPQAIFQHPDLWDIYAKWSPDGQWIAAVSGVQHEPTGKVQTDLTFTYWLVPAGGGPARELAQRETSTAGYSADEVSWSPDGQYLLAHTRVYDLAGNQLMPEGIGGLDWLPDRPQLFHLATERPRIISVTGEEIALVEQSAYHSTLNWALSNDGRRLVFSQKSTDAGVPLAIYDLESGETQIAGTIPNAIYDSELRWSEDDTKLIAGVDYGEGRYAIWTLEARPGSTAERLIENAVLIEVVPYPVR